MVSIGLSQRQMQQTSVIGCTRCLGMFAWQAGCQSVRATLNIRTASGRRPRQHSQEPASTSSWRHRQEFKCSTTAIVI